MGCTLCEVYCTLEHSSSKEIIKAYLREIPHPHARIKINQDKPQSIAIQCHNCSDPPCVNACLTGAMSIDELSGNVIHNQQKCIGCWTCVMICPFGALIVEPGLLKTPLKCDLCPNLKVPACVDNCPNEALVIEEVVQE
jgi:carbon-monoxide dehydrogenase iron sulfur subunit